MDNPVSYKWLELRLAALLSLFIHLLAGLAMVFVLRHGLESNPNLEERLRFLSHHTFLWRVAWFTWNLAALSILYFYFAFAKAHENDQDKTDSILNMTVLIGAAAVAVDLCAEAIQMGVLPILAGKSLAEPASGSGPSQMTFLSLDRMSVIMTGYVANGLYTLSAVLLAWFTRRHYPVWVWIAGLCVGGAGFSLSGAALLGSVKGMVWANMFLMPAIVVWQTGVAIKAGEGKTD